MDSIFTIVAFTEMYHKIADVMPPGRKVRYALTIILVFIILPGVNSGIQALDLRQFIHPVDSYSLNQPTQGVQEQVRLARGVILSAKKSMTDPNFAKTVLLITEYDETGTVGLVLNRPLEKLAVEILPQLQELNLDSLNLYLGGPVRLNSLRLLVQTGIDLGEDYQVIDNVFQITDLQGVRHLLQQKMGQFHLRLYAGYAGWHPGQLERELLRGDWHLSRVDTALIFTDDPASLWERLIDQMDMQWVSRNQKKTLNVSFRCTPSLAHTLRAPFGRPNLLPLICPGERHNTDVVAGGYRNL